jgi:hypothetical protein
MAVFIETFRLQRRKGGDDKAPAVPDFQREDFFLVNPPAAFAIVAEPRFTCVMY